jgi:CBS-domain-containing membrane protein
MVDGGIHRIVVVDADQTPLGIVSSTDILAAVARAAHPLVAPSVKVDGQALHTASQ